MKNCPEPHHQHAPYDKRAHKAHHWKERAICMSFCTVLHLVLEFGFYVFH